MSSMTIKHASHYAVSVTFDGDQIGGFVSSTANLEVDNGFVVLQGGDGDIIMLDKELVKSLRFTPVYL